MFVVIEGLDGCGKSTQFELLKKHYGTDAASDRREVKFLSFPNYESGTGAVIKDYLAGKYRSGGDASVSAYSAAAMFAVDRYCSFAEEWRGYINGDCDILAQRYVTSNVIYQAAKLAAKSQGAFIRWVYDFEYDKLGLPKPDLVIFLELSVAESVTRIKTRGDSDIHENVSFQIQCARVAAKLAKSHSPRWIKVPAAGDVETVNTALLDVLDSVGFGRTVVIG